ncbi:MAG: hypothetical protein HZA20_11395 [Nitrospirae bacterium]|nr:hypothetical protein [Nitrospirota bacterium]
MSSYFSDPQRLNRYAYVKNNPLKYVDPSGLDTFGFGGTISGSFLAYCFQADLMVNVGYSGKDGVTWSVTLDYGGGASSSLSAGIGVTATVTNAPSVAYLNGTSLVTSKPVGPVTVSGITGKTDGQEYAGASVTYNPPSLSWNSGISMNGSSVSVVNTIPLFQSGTESINGSTSDIGMQCPFSQVGGSSDDN